MSRRVGHVVEGDGDGSSGGHGPRVGQRRRGLHVDQGHVVAHAAHAGRRVIGVGDSERESVEADQRLFRQGASGVAELAGHFGRRVVGLHQHRADPVSAGGERVPDQLPDTSSRAPGWMVTVPFQ